ncbi:Sigma-70 region 2 [Collimonas sp. OK607]|nr:Sigma-70 region 2 [Collimonas sp. OK607]
MRQPALIFILENKKQIEQKAKKFGVDFDDVCQEICLIFIEKATNFDASRGAFKGFIFGHLDKLLRRKSIGALRFAASIDDSVEKSKMMRVQVESVAMTDADETRTYGRCLPAPGQERLEASAQIISGKSARELAVERGITTRRMNQILKNVREEAAVQFDLEFTKEQK